MSILVLAGAIATETPAEKPFEVHLTGGSASAVEILGPAAIVLAALVGAWFAARYAHRNVVQELAAADHRLDAQMAHDRELRERQATRETLDEVVATVTKALAAAADFGAAVSIAEGMRREVGELETEHPRYKDTQRHLQAFEEETLIPNREEAVETSLQTHPARLRLRLRFVDDHPIVSAFAELQDAIDLSYDHLSKGMDGIRTEKELEEAQEATGQIPNSLAKFVAAVRAWSDSTSTETSSHPAA